jgi:hypothetical protein
LFQDGSKPAEATLVVHELTQPVRSPPDSRAAR